MNSNGRIDREGNPLTSNRSGLFRIGWFSLVFILGVHAPIAYVQGRNNAVIHAPQMSTQVIASNVPPVAGNDSYWTRQGEPLSVPAPGILENDQDFDGDHLSAQLEDTPERGILGLNPDGSFMYTPETGFVGQDVFRYRASDGELESNLAEVVITVSEMDNQSPSVQWVSPAVDEGAITVYIDEIIPLEVSAADNAGIAGVRFYRWDAVDLTNVEIGIVYTPPYRWDLMAQELNWGPNQINVKAYDLSGNESARKHIWLYLYRRVFLPVMNK